MDTVNCTDYISGLSLSELWPAVISAWEHDAPCGGWKVEKNDDED